MAPSTDPFPANDGDTPETAIPVTTKGGAPKVIRFNWQVHEAVQKCLNKGVWCDLGPLFGGLLVRLRAFHVDVVVSRREAEERNVRRMHGVKDGEDTPAELMIGINRVAVVMAITGVKGEIDMGEPEIKSSDPAILAEMEWTAKALTEARKVGLPVTDIEGRPVLVFNGSEDNEATRKVFLQLLTGSMSMLTAMVTASKNLQTVKDEEIYRLGEAYVYGRAEESSLAG